jgi:hypothetical protein
MTWKIGILIAGSLYWRAIPHRERWREQFLHKDLATAVRAPIRYGRLSRSKTYTMVYAPNTPAGQAKVVVMNDDEAAVYEFCIQLHRTLKVDDATFNRPARAWRTRRSTRHRGRLRGGTYPAAAVGVAKGSRSRRSSDEDRC